MPDSFARRQDLKKEEAACCVRFPPLLRQIYYIFRRKANVTFPRFNICPSASPCPLCAEAVRQYTMGSLYPAARLPPQPFPRLSPPRWACPCRKSPRGSIETASKRNRNRDNPHRNRNNPPYHRPKIPIRSGRGAVAPRFFLPLPVTFQKIQRKWLQALSALPTYTYDLRYPTE